MSTSLAECGQLVQRLYARLRELERAAVILEIPDLHQREWYGLLVEKLVPQLVDDAFLVTAVVGGTNIGKSAIFNHLAGERASAVCPIASGTKHPVCLVPTGFGNRHSLADIFPGFKLRPWKDPEAPLEETETHLLFWRESAACPETLLVLDTPDIDSAAKVNWLRADMIRRSADVLIAVLTQQKYNDAAVKQFFRKAAEEDKACIAVFNQCQLPDDEQYWPMWLQTFCRATGIRPEFGYVAPLDRRAAESNSLPFYRRIFSLDEAGEANVAPAHTSDDTATGSLMVELSRLHFPEIKLRSLRGSLQSLLSEKAGLPSYLGELTLRSHEFASAAEMLSAHTLGEVNDWPSVPNAALLGELRRWWRTQRTGWTSRVHGFYDAVGSAVVWPVNYSRKFLSGPAEAPLETYRRGEWNAILRVVGSVYERLERMAAVGNKLLQPRLAAVLEGTSREQLLAELKSAHDAVDLEDELRRLVTEQLRTMRDESPQFYQMLRRLDETAAIARPAVSVALFVVGFGPAGHAAASLATDTAMQTAVHFAGDVVGGTVAAAVGETAVSSTASSGAS